MKTQQDLEKLQNNTESENKSDYVSVSVSPKLIGIILAVVVIIAVLLVVFTNIGKKKTTPLNMNHNNTTETVKHPEESVEKPKESSINNEPTETEKTESSDNKNNEDSGIVKIPTDANQQNKGMLSTYENLLQSGADSGDLYVTGDIVVGKGKDVEPGIYDMTFLGGSLNGCIDHPEFGLIFYGENNEVARLILTEGTHLGVFDVSKVKFTAVRKEEILSEFKQGYYLVGKDIKPGKYLVSTNGKLGRGFWSIWVCSDDGAGNYSADVMQTYESGNTDIAIDLKEGNILCLSCDRWECTGNLVLTELN